MAEKIHPFLCAVHDARKFEVGLLERKERYLGDFIDPAEYDLFYIGILDFIKE